MTALENALIREGYNHIGRLITDVFSVTDQLTRPANTTAYAANQSINMNGTVTEVAYTLLVVTVKVVAHGLLTGDRITVAGVNSGATLTNVDGNWIITQIDADHFSFTVTTQPTGTTPQTGLTITGAIAKMLSFDVAGVVGGGILLNEIKVSLPGKAMTGTIRIYIDTVQVAVLVDGTTYPLLIANQAYRKSYCDLYPVVENASSDCTIALWNGSKIIKPESTDTRIYLRVVAEAAQTPASAGVVSVLLTGMQLLG